MRGSSILKNGIFRCRHAAFLAMITAAGLAGTAAAQGVYPAAPADFADGAEALKPGQFVWTPDASPSGTIVIYVDLSRQLAAVYRDGVRIGVTTVSSGRKGYETPTGVFTILQKDPNHHSNKYENAPMPFQERLTWDGVALHAGGVPGYPESRGCVHLPYGFAKALFKETRIGTTVVLEDGPAEPDLTKIAPAPVPTEVAAVTAAPLGEAPSERPVTLVSTRGD